MRFLRLIGNLFLLPFIIVATVILCCCGMMIRGRNEDDEPDALEASAEDAAEEQQELEDSGLEGEHDDRLRKNKWGIWSMMDVGPSEARKQIKRAHKRQFFVPASPKIRRDWLDAERNATRG